MIDLLGRRLLFVTGKGGVGKTSVAASLAAAAAARGRRTLVCSLEAQAELPASFGLGPVGFDPVEVPGHPDLAVMAMDTEASLREYLRLHLHLPVPTRLGPLAGTFDYLAHAAPGVRELLAVGKLAWDVRAEAYDLVVVDAPASGHAVGYLRAPTAVRELVHLGMIRAQTEWMTALFADPAVTGAVVVSTPEEMAVTEAVELVDALGRLTPVRVAAAVANRALAEPFTRRSEALFAALGAPGPSAALQAALGPGAEALLVGPSLALTRRREGATHLESLARQVAPLPVLHLPELDDAPEGPERTRRLAAALEDELG